MPRKSEASHQCVESVHNDFGVGHHQCSRKGVVLVKGKWYCRIHDPAAVANRMETRNARWKVEADRQRRANVRGLLEKYKANLFDDLVSCLKTHVPANPAVQKILQRAARISKIEKNLEAETDAAKKA